MVLDKFLIEKNKSKPNVCMWWRFLLPPLFSETEKKSFGCKKYLEKNLLFFDRAAGPLNRQSQELAKRPEEP